MTDWNFLVHNMTACLNDVMSLVHAVGSTLVTIVIGTVIGVLFIILVINLVIYVDKEIKRKHRTIVASPGGREAALPNPWM